MSEPDFDYNYVYKPEEGVNVYVVITGYTPEFRGSFDEPPSDEDVEYELFYEDGSDCQEEFHDPGVDWVIKQMDAERRGDEIDQAEILLDLREGF